MTDVPDAATRRFAAIRPHRQPLSRRAVLIGAGATGLAAAGAGAGFLINEQGSTPPGTIAGGQQAPGAADTPTLANPNPATPNIVTPSASPRGESPARPAVTVPPGMALVTSPRLPLYGVGPEAPDWLLAGEADDWRTFGSAVSIPVQPLALAGESVARVQPLTTFADYEALVAGLESYPGGVALVAIEDLDFRVNVLSVANVDPLLTEDDSMEPAIRIGVAGDIVPGRNVHLHMVKYGDFTRPFHDVAAHLADYDLTFANLEGNLSETLSQPADPHSFSFVSDPAMIDGFKLAGLDAVTLANNHSVFNEEGWGVQGLLDTLQALEAADVPYFGAGRDLAAARQPWTTTINGTSVALLGIDGVTANVEIEPGVTTGVVGADAAAGADQPGTNPYDSALFLADIAAAAARADVVIPYFHMGEEYVAVPPRWAVNGARAAIDAGATMVVTLHPHVIQGMEIYAGKPIIYSPGNFIFDQMFSVEVRSGFILDVTIRGKRVVRSRIHGVDIEEFHKPRLMNAGEQANLMDRYWSATDRLALRGA